MPESSTEEPITRDDVVRWLQWDAIYDHPNGIPAKYWHAVRDWVETKPNTVGNVWHWAWLLKKLRAVRKNGRRRA